MLRIKLSKDGKTFCAGHANDKLVVGYGSTIAQAVGNYVLNNKEYFALCIEPDASAARSEQDRCKRERSEALKRQKEALNEHS